MQIKIINLASQSTRWSEAGRQFAAAGLAITRHEAIEGSRMTRDEAAAYYSDSLNARQYHRPLRPGEIACYASHMSAWQALVDSGDSAVAIFEDDVEVDDDLAAVLDAVLTVSARWDVVKLIGRDREKILASRPLLESRRLIRYRRVPSLTGAYLVTAEGAAKLLAHRKPFGRPIDVDMRYWWECDLGVLGVYPYPVHVAPTGHISCIGVRRSGDRIKKLWQQGVYSWRNWQANRGGPRTADFPVTRPAVQPIPAAPAAAVRAAAPPVPRRNLVVVRAGDKSLHREWLDGTTRDFDLFISYYGTTPGRHREDADLYEARPGPKWPCLAALLQERPDLVDRYQAFWFPDDDLSANGATIDRLFAFFRAYELCLAQPALTANSYATWNTLFQDTRCHIRYTGFVEIMAPLFSRRALEVCARTFAESPSGWGLDWVWPTLCRRAGLGRIAIVDATPVRHTRPLGGELYRNHPTMDPRADAARILRDYGIEEVRATAKYAFEGQVRDVALPLPTRLLFWLKRLNGRRLNLRHLHGRSKPRAPA